MTESPRMSRLYNIQPVAGKGLGVIANIKISRGSRIMAESPVLTFKQMYATEGELREAVMQKINDLSPEGKAFFYTLHQHGPDEDRELEILATNSLPAGLPAPELPDYNPKGIYIDACRLNHDCRSNAIYTWNEGLKQIVVHAIKDIRCGEEITVNYNHAFKLRKPRREALLADFGFLCSCCTCSLPQELQLKSDRRIVEIRILRDYAFESKDQAHSPLRFLHALRRLLDLLLDEDLHTWNADWIYKLAFETSLSLGDYIRAKAFVNRAAAIRAVCAGEDDDRAMQYRDWTRDPRKHDLYQNVGKLKRLDVDAAPQALSTEAFDAWLWRDPKAVASSSSKAASFAAGLAITPFESLPSDDEAKSLLEHSFVRKKAPSHWCFIAEIVDVEYLSEFYVVVKDRTGQRLPASFRPDQHGMATRLQSSRPGLIMAILYAKRFIFPNGTVGLHVKDASQFKV